MYTLVRHNLWTVGAFPLFRRGLEPLRVGQVTADAVLRRGGLLFATLDEAWDAAEGFMYPTGGTAPDPSGGFTQIFFLRQPLFIPEFSGDLLAA